MAEISSGPVGSATIKMSDGLELRVPGFNSAPNVTVQDVRNVCTALFELAASLDKRVAALEKSAK